MYIPMKDSFEPSSNTLRKWLGTRKPTYTISGAQFPGFFSDPGNSMDTFWVSIAFGTEILGLSLAIYGALNRDTSTLLFTIAAALFLIVIDFVFALLLHKDVAIKCKLKTQLILLSDSNSVERVNITNELAKGGFLKFLLGIALFIVAVVKIFGITMLGIFSNMAIYFPVYGLFLITGYIHFSKTWYFVSYQLTQNAINDDHKKFGDGHNKAIIRKEIVKTPSPLRSTPINHFPHKIEKTGSENEYMIETTGILLDEEIMSLIQGQDDFNRIVLFKACRKLQSDNLGLEWN